MAYKPVSKYIKNKIKGHSFIESEYRNYISRLVFLEKSITQGIFGIGGNIVLHNLKIKYEKEYHTIFKELKPKEFVKYIQNKRMEEILEKKEDKEFEIQERREMKNEKNLWLSSGGIE